ncbi:tetratricopeptide repeat protein [Saccharothrix carnea]|uniref:Tetratricopeptide repeat protein n=1 Tax=Saccharothrix carnea TaxID=1280637 RepID=A0A2P8I2L2_SACCR|nr:tetratricopeptide repeat protein [Saccharothrix carnea]PSL52708.1 tetratricopeptide repeat protein [Saccharothrix carnea]
MASAPPDEDDRSTASARAGGFDVRGNLGPQIGDHNTQHNTIAVTLPPARVAWPVRVGVPPQVVHHFQDRAARSQLAEALSVGRAAVVVGAGSGATVVSGLGGVGKSQLAADYAWRWWRDRSLDVAVWVSALSRDAVISAYAEVARQVLREQDPGIANRTPEEAARSLRTWLAGTDRRWLIVLDDVQAPADLRDLRPPHSPVGQVVITTRRRDTALAGSGDRLVEVGVFTEREAFDYLDGALPEDLRRDTDPEQLRGLADDLGRLPLALTQAVAFIADKPLLTVEQYRERLADRRRSLADVMPTQAELPDPHERTVAATWSLSIDLADRLPPTGAARPLLALAGLLDPNGTPPAVFTTTAVLAHLTAIVGRDVDRDAVTDALAVLHRLSLATLDTRRPARTLAVHAMVQRVVRDTLTPAELHDLAHVAANAVLGAWPGIDTTDPDLAQALRSATESLHACTAPALWRPEGHTLLFRAGVSLGGSGQVAAAVEHFRLLREQAEDRLGPDHPDTLRARWYLAYWRGETGDTAGAVAELEALLIDQHRVLGPDDPDTLDTRNDLASGRGETGDAAGAVAELEALLVDQQRVLGADHPDTLDTRANITRWKGEAGNPAKAAAECEVLLVDFTLVLGHDHPATLMVRHELARWKGEAGDPVSAVADFEALLGDYRNLLGADHPHTFTTRHNLAHWRGETGDTATAAAELQALLADQLRVLGPDHPHTLTTRHSLAHWRGQAGDTATATAELHTLLTDQERVLGPDHVQTTATSRSLAHWRARHRTTEAASPVDHLLRDP